MHVIINDPHSAKLFLHPDRSGGELQLYDGWHECKVSIVFKEDSAIEEFMNEIVNQWRRQRNELCLG